MKQPRTTARPPAHALPERLFRYGRLFLLLSALLSLSCSVGRDSKLDRVSQQIRAVLDLPAYEHVYREVIYLGMESSFFGIRTQDKRLLFAVDMRVLAGVPLAEGFELIPRGPTRIDVLLPEAQILMIDADEKSIQQFFILEWGGTITHTEYYEEIEAGKEAVRQDALDRGILVKAGDNARELIEDILTGAGYREIRFLTAKEVSR